MFWLLLCCSQLVSGATPWVAPLFDPSELFTLPKGEDYDLRDLSLSQVQTLKSHLWSMGLVLIRDQKLTREDQVEFTKEIGDFVRLPQAFQGNDPHEIWGITRVTNVDKNGDWKGADHAFGNYWHQDGDFHRNHHIVNILYADEISENMEGGGTEICLSYRFKNLVPLPKILEWQSKNVSVNIDDIGDFVGMTEEDYRNYPPVTHPILDQHPKTNQDMAYIGSIHAQVANDTSKDHGNSKVRSFIDEICVPSNVYSHSWRKGDVLIWDNLLVYHRAGKYNVENESVRRIMYRSQAQIPQ